MFADRCSIEERSWATCANPDGRVSSLRTAAMLALGASLLLCISTWRTQEGAAVQHMKTINRPSSGTAWGATVQHLPKPMGRLSAAPHPGTRGQVRMLASTSDEHTSGTTLFDHGSNIFVGAAVFLATSLGFASFSKFFKNQEPAAELLIPVQGCKGTSSSEPAEGVPSLLRKLGQTTTAVLTASSLTLNGLIGPAMAIETLVREPPPLIKLTKEEESTVKLFQQNTPSVVYVTNLATVGKINRQDWSLDLTEIPRGSGTGFVWDDQGHIVTNHHVIAGASDVRITTIDQSAYKAKVLGFDEDKDVALLQVDDPEAIAKFVPVSLGCSQGLLVGQKVLAIGNPFGLDHTLTQGIISGLGRVITSTTGRPISGVIQTDAAINPGNSGGPLLDSAGNVIGMNSAILDPTGQGASAGVGFAIPIDIVKSVASQLLTFGRVLRPVIGVTIAPDATLASLKTEGILVLDVPRGSPADKAGIRPSKRDRDTGRLILGDIIIALDGKKIANTDDYFTVIDDYLPGDVITVTVLRDGDGSNLPRKVDLNVRLAERNAGRD